MYGPSGFFGSYFGGVFGVAEAEPDELAAGLVYPKGRIHPDLFPSRTASQLEADVAVWLAEGYAHPLVASLSSAQQDAAAKEWAYYRAFDAACIAMAANPANAAQTDAGSSSYAKDQRQRVCQYADAAFARFYELAPAVADAARHTGGRTVTHTFAW